MGDLLTWPRFPFFVRVLVAVNAKFKTLFLSSMVSAGLISGLWVEPGCARGFRGSSCGGPEVAATGRSEGAAIDSLYRSIARLGLQPCASEEVRVSPVSAGGLTMYRATTRAARR